MSINKWPQDERPRERLVKKGATALSDAELLAIFLRVGVKGKSAVDLARELIRHFGSLRALFTAPKESLCAVHGMGPAKYVQLQAVLEMAKRALDEQIRITDVLTSPQTVKDYLRHAIAG